MLPAFQGVEDQLSTLRILAQEVVEQHTAVNSANRYLDLLLVRYRGGVNSYLTVITAQNAELQVELRQVLASVGLILLLIARRRMGFDATADPAARPPSRRDPMAAVQPFRKPCSRLPSSRHSRTRLRPRLPIRNRKAQ